VVLGPVGPRDIATKIATKNATKNIVPEVATVSDKKG
jgi:hypothetical protein